MDERIRNKSPEYIDMKLCFSNSDSEAEFSSNEEKGKLDNGILQVQQVQDAFLQPGPIIRRRGYQVEHGESKIFLDGDEKWFVYYTGL